MNSLICILTAVSALTGQLYSTPACNGLGCRTNSAFGSTRSSTTNPQFDSRQYSQFGDPLMTAACQCRTCDPRIPCSPENCDRQNCADCLNGCRNCVSDRFAPQINDGWEPRASNRQPVRPSHQVSTQRLCPVTGEALGSMGPPIPVTISGRTIQVCCDACVAAVQRSPQKYFQRVAKEIGSSPVDSFRGTSNRPQSNPRASAQRLCPVTGEELGSMRPPIPVTISGRTIQVCCDSCVAAVRRSPERYFQRVAEELQMVPMDSLRGSSSRPQSSRQASAQRLCPVTGEELGSMGPPIPVTISGHTIQVCCEACVAAVRRNPAKYLAKVEDELNSASGRPMSGRLTSGSIPR